MVNCLTSYAASTKTRKKNIFHEIMTVNLLAKIENMHGKWLGQDVHAI